MVWIDADRVLVPCPVDDRELPVTDAVAFPALHVVAYVRTEVIAHAHRRIGRNADDRIAVSIGIALVRQAVRKAGPPGHIESERMSPSGPFQDIVAEERVEIMWYVVLEGIANALRTASGIRISVRYRQAQPLRLPLQHDLKSPCPACSVDEAAAPQQEIVAVVDQRQVAHSFIIALYRKGQVFVQLRTATERYLPCVL